jgi:hypothetical protein
MAEDSLSDYFATENRSKDALHVGWLVGLGIEEEEESWMNA